MNELLSERGKIWHLRVHSFFVSACGEPMPSPKQLKAPRLLRCAVEDHVRARLMSFKRIHQLNRVRKSWCAELCRKVFRLSFDLEMAEMISGSCKVRRPRHAALTDPVTELARPKVVSVDGVRIVAWCLQPACVLRGRDQDSSSIDEGKFLASRHLWVQIRVADRSAFDFIQSVGQKPNPSHDVGDQFNVQYLHKRSQLRKKSEMADAIEELLH